MKTIEGYVAVNFEVPSISTIREFPKRSFCDGDVGDSSGGVNAICSRMEVADDVFSGEGAVTFQEYVGIHLWSAIFSSFRENLSQSEDDGWSS